ncbi:LytR C-terminal domain-containing protein [Kitasatospora sp. NPDC057015]|uniref:LytR C-terminal domain-containing protein n=1 Tax=Kitasatospora sp. NPDC057015 TaxID=3346001 RepID=UPI003636D948
MTGTADRRGQQDDDWSTGQYPQYQQQQPYPPYRQQPGYEQSGHEQSGHQQAPYEQAPYEQSGYEPQYDQYGQPYPSYQQPARPQPGYEQEQYGRADRPQAYAPQYDRYGQPQAYPQSPGYESPQSPGYGSPAYEEYQQPGYGQQPYQPYRQPEQQQPGYGQPAQDAPGYEQAAQREPFAAAAPPVAAAPAAPPRPRPARPAPQAAPVKPEQPSEQVGGSRAAKGAKAPADDYATGEFTFVEEEAEESEDVIDWLKFAESRTERRDERRRKLRNRLVGAVVVLAVLGGAGTGYLWFTGKLGGAKTAASAAGPRQVNVVHLRDLQGKVSSALLVNDASGHKGSVLLLPEGLKLPGAGDPPTVALGQAMDTIGASNTREGLGNVLGAPVAGTWRLDTPYLQLLVAQLGGVRADIDVELREAGKPDGKVLASPGKNVLLSGQAAVQYATYQGAGEGRDVQLARFGQVLEAIVKTMPTDLKDATDVVTRMGAVLDPSLPKDALAGVLVQLAQQAKDGHFATSALPVKPDGGLDDATAGKQVKEVLGGTVHSADSVGAAARVAIQDASGNDQAAAAAQVQVTNAGLTFVPGTAKSTPQATSEIRYTDDARQEAAKSLATSLNLPETVVKKVTGAQTADLLVVLGKDYQAPKPQ